jgi:hypothetical protein
MNVVDLTRWAEAPRAIRIEFARLLLAWQAAVWAAERDDAEHGVSPGVGEEGLGIGHERETAS